MTGRQVQDTDGDVWRQEADGGWACQVTPGEMPVSYLPSLDIIERIYGPVSEVTL